MSEHWSLGSLIAFPIFAFLWLLCVAVFLIAVVVAIRSDKGSDDRGVGITFAFGSAFIGTIILAVVASPLGMYPYKVEYHKWIPHDGAIGKIAERQVSTGDGMETKYVVQFEGSGQQYGCNDTRCALLEPGDYLALSCKKVWEWAATDGYDCRFVKSEAK